jgi:REP element-mobilizing transposase RayT
MTRPLRIELPGGIYHVTSRGDRRGAIYLTDADRLAWLTFLAQTCNRFAWRCHAWCQMTNHYHIVIETIRPTLSAGMRHLNGVFTQYINRAHQRVGHVFQGRYKAILVERDAHLLELSRYVVLNPVRAGITQAAADWPWSSYHAMLQPELAPPWMSISWLLAQFGSAQPPFGYRTFVASAMPASSPWPHVKGQIFLGSEEFMMQMQEALAGRDRIPEIPLPQQMSPAKPLSFYLQNFEDRNRAISAAFASGHYTQRALARAFRIHDSTVSRILHAARK